MRRIVKLLFAALATLLLQTVVHAKSETSIASSCNSNYAIYGNKHHQYFVKKISTGKQTPLKTTHEISNAVFDMKNKVFVVYGLPRKIDRDYPQARVLSVYKNPDAPRLLHRQTFGSGIYDVSFVADKNQIVVDEKGSYLIDLSTKKSVDIGTNPPAIEVCANAVKEPLHNP